MAYVDEAGFAQTHPNRSAWTPVGEPHRIPAARGRRMNVVVALLGNGKVFSARLWCTFTAELFVGFVGLLGKQVDKPLTIILDNTSNHKAKAIAPYLKHLRSQGVTLYFLPPYSPELNRIEKLWHLMKHTWMAVKHRAPHARSRCRGNPDNFGTTYKMVFQL